MAGSKLWRRAMTGVLPLIFLLRVPAVPPALNQLSPSCLPSHCYVTADQIWPSNKVSGVGGNFTEPRTLQGVTPAAYSIGQLVLGTASADIEFGWLVNPSAYGDSYPHLFIALRAAGNPNQLCEIGVPKSAQPSGAHCPRGTYEQLSKTYRPGMAVGGALNNGAAPVLYHVNYHQGWWRIQYKSSGWMGKINGAYWSNLGVSFTAGDEASWFGEIASSEPCTPMGTGLYATRPGAARITKMFYEEPGSGKINAAARLLAATHSRYWGYKTPSPVFSSFDYGGPYDSSYSTCKAPGTWGKATEVPGTAALNTGKTAETNSVSCSSPGNCSAGGDYTDISGNQQAYVVSQVKGGWGNAVEVPGTASLNASGYATITSVSCASAGACSGGGYYTDSTSHRQAFVVSQVKGSWGNAIEVPGTAALNTGGTAETDSVSCASAGNCSAGGYYTDGTGHLQAYVVSQVNGTWGSAVEVPGTAALNAGGNAQVNSVSCPSAGNCSIGGDYVDSSSNTEAFVASEVDGTWRNAIEVPGTPAPGTGGDARVDSVSCASSGNCSASGIYASGTFVVSQVNGTWRKAAKVPGTAALNPIGGSLSCASAGNCSAGGSYDDPHGVQAFVVSQVNGTWGKAIEIPGTAALNIDGEATITSVSCASAGNCSAGGWYRDSSNSERAFVVSQVNGTWGKAIAVPGTSTGSSAVTSVSCASAGNCSAGGLTYTARQGVEAFVVSETAGL